MTIRPRRLEQVVGEAATKIDKIARLSIDVDGHHEDVWGYVIPGQSEDLILGKGWLARHDASIRPAREEVIIRRPWTGVLKTRDVRKDVNEISVAAFRAYRARIAKQGDSEGGIRIFAASLQDLEKALAPKKHTDPREACPEWLRPVIDAFDRNRAKELPPHRPGLDHEINLVEGREPPAMPLYSMSRDELLVLRKTLYELLDQGFI